LLWFYHRQVLVGDGQAVPESDGAAIVRRLYLLGFSAAGLTMTTWAVIGLVRWLMYEFGPAAIHAGGFDPTLTHETIRLIVGGPLWLIFWYQVQQLFAASKPGERESTLRKFYLYTVVFFSAMGVVSCATAILAGVFRRLLALPPQGDIRDALAIGLGLSLVWTYHAFTLRDDARRVKALPRQAEIRRLYAYLVAAIGLLALLIGLGGEISVLLRSIDGGFGNQLREEVAWFTAAIVAGLPVWLLSWLQEQEQVAAQATGANERRSLVRKTYLYFFLFIAAMTVLGSTIFIVSSLLTWLFGEEAATWTQLGHAVAFSLLAAAVWV
jgi:hypothetical protein